MKARGTKGFFTWLAEYAFLVLVLFLFFTYAPGNWRDSTEFSRQAVGHCLHLK